MKKFLLLLVINITALLSISSAQCSSIPCANPINVVCLQNVSYTGDQCFQGPSTIANSVNWNNWLNLTFDTYIIVNQTINIPNNGKVYSVGYNQFHNIHFSGNSNMYITDGWATIDHMTSNNSTSTTANNIYLASGCGVIYDGTQYFVGDVIQLPGNATNVVNVLACTGSPLPLTIESFELKDKMISWKVNLDPGQKAELQYAGHANSNDFQTHYISGKQFDSRKAEVGYYRLKVDMKYSNVIHIAPGNAPSAPGVMRDIYTGQVIKEAIPFRPYVQDGKVKEVIR